MKKKFVISKVEYLSLEEVEDVISTSGEDPIEGEEEELVPSQNPQ